MEGILAKKGRGETSTIIFGECNNVVRDME
jgi:hypothetical protein